VSHDPAASEVSTESMTRLTKNVSLMVVAAQAVEAAAACEVA
jgi:hypothetical protein